MELTLEKIMVGPSLAKTYPEPEYPEKPRPYPSRC